MIASSGRGNAREAFEEAEQKLRSVYGTENVSDTIYALVMERYNALECGSPAQELKRLKNRKVVVVNGQRKVVTR
jgi:hypothetical protein